MRVLHLLAIARALHVTFQSTTRRIRALPFSCDRPPRGPSIVLTMHARVAFEVIEKLFSQNGVLHGEALPVSGQRLPQPSKKSARASPDRMLIRPMEKDGLTRRAPLTFFEEFGNRRAVAKISGVKKNRSRARQRFRLRRGLPSGDPCRRNRPRRCNLNRYEGAEGWARNAGNARTT